VPSPVGHTLAGLCGYMVAKDYGLPRRQGWLLIVSVVIPNLADIDFLPGLLLGDPRIVHRQVTHSIVAAIIVGLLIGCLASRWRLSGTWWGIWGGGLYLSHIILDLLVADSNPPLGLQFLWPFSGEYFIAPVTPFPGFDYYSPAIGMVRTLLSFDNLESMLREVVLMAPFVGLAWYYGQYRRRGLLESGQDRSRHVPNPTEAPRHWD
jgi:inner membrane protein